MGQGGGGWWERGENGRVWTEIWICQRIGWERRGDEKGGRGEGMNRVGEERG